MIDEAILFAVKAHEGQFRKGTNIPYILHPLEAMIIVSEIKYHEDLISAAVLHDVAEDTNYNLQDIKNLFGNRVYELVSAQSEDKSKHWYERKSHTLELLSQENDQDILMVALGDKLSNIGAIYRDYLEIGDNLWKRFNVKDKSMQGWYYKGLVKCFQPLSVYQAFSEFSESVDKVFQ